MSNREAPGTVPPEKRDFYDLAAKFAEETSSSDQPHLLLKLWAHRFPEYAADLAAIAYARLVEPGENADHSSAAEEEEIAASARRVLDRLKAGSSPLISLTTAAASAGVTPHDLAERLRIDIPLFAKLEQRLLTLTSIPTVLIDSLASAIGRTGAEVAAYLSGPPKLAVNAMYRSKRPPKVDDSMRQTFAHALDASRSLSQENKAYWQAQLDDTGSR